MKRLLWRTLALLLMSAGPLLYACQPAPTMVQPSSTPAPVNIPPTLTPTTQPDYQVRWSYQTGGAIWSAPAIGDGIVYFGSDDHNLYAVNAQTGDLKWTFGAQGLVRSRPAIADTLVYFASDDGYLYALNAQSGEQVWRVDVGNVSESDKRENFGLSTDPTGYDYLQSSPVVADGQVYVGSADGNVYALAADTGDIRWMFKTGHKVRATPTANQGVVYVGSWDGSVYALDALTGQARWQTPIGGQVQTAALVADGVVYCASRKASVVALDAQTGSIKWEYDYGDNMWVESSPILVGDLIYIGSSGNKYVVGLDSQTGARRAVYSANIFFWSTPAIIGDTLYIGAAAYRGDHSTGGLVALEIPATAVSGGTQVMQHKWMLPVPETLMPDGNWLGVASSPVVAGGILYFGGLDGVLYAVFPQP